MSAPRRHWGGVVGPLGFIGAWVCGAMFTSRAYSSVDDTISRLAESGADTQLLMTCGFIAFGVAVPIYSTALSRAVARAPAFSAATTGIATLGVAATPLGYSPGLDAAHYVAATIGYISLALTPLLAYRPLVARAPRLARAGLVAGAMSTLLLTLSVLIEPDGLFQRAGLTATDLWLIASAFWMARTPTPAR